MRERLVQGRRSAISSIIFIEGTWLGDGEVHENCVEKSDRSTTTETEGMLPAKDRDVS